MQIDPDGIALSADWTWPQVVVFGIMAIVAIAALTMPSVLSWLASRRTNATLTTTNGGSHVKDQLNRVERGVARSIRVAVRSLRLSERNADDLAELRTRFDQHLERRAHARGRHEESEA